MSSKHRYRAWCLHVSLLSFVGCSSPPAPAPPAAPRSAQAPAAAEAEGGMTDEELLAIPVEESPPAEAPAPPAAPVPAHPIDIGMERVGALDVQILPEEAPGLSNWFGLWRTREYEEFFREAATLPEETLKHRIIWAANLHRHSQIDRVLDDDSWLGFAAVHLVVEHDAHRDEYLAWFAQHRGEKATKSFLARLGRAYVKAATCKRSNCTWFPVPASVAKSAAEHVDASVRAWQRQHPSK